MCAKADRYFPANHCSVQAPSNAWDTALCQRGVGRTGVGRCRPCHFESLPTAEVQAPLRKKDRTSQCLIITTVDASASSSNKGPSRDHGEPFAQPRNTDEDLHQLLNPELAESLYLHQGCPSITRVFIFFLLLDQPINIQTC